MVVLRHLYIFIFTIKRGEVVSVRKKDVWYVIKTRAIGKNRDLDFLRDGKKPTLDEVVLKLCIVSSSLILASCRSGPVVAFPQACEKAHPISWLGILVPHSNSSLGIRQQQLRPIPAGLSLGCCWSLNPGPLIYTHTHTLSSIDQCK
jgi:hypothetical protein